MDNKRYEIARKKAEILTEALPYIKSFHKKIIVIKYGGSTIANSKIKQSFFKDIVLMKLVGMKPIIVHGGGPEITSMLNKLGKETYFVNGLRYTDKEIMEVVEMVLVGKINKEIVSGINYNGGNAFGICGKDGGMVTAEKLYQVVCDKNNIKKKIDIGYVGKVKKINTTLLLDVLKKDYIPVISPIGADDDQNTYNINADFVAGEIASNLKVDKFVLLTDAGGIYKKNKNNKKNIFNSISIEEINQLIKNKTIVNGMIPKVKCCIDAINKGVNKVHIIDGNIPHSILLEIFTKEGIGTMITK